MTRGAISRRSALRLGGVALSAAISGCSVLARSESDRIAWKTTLDDGTIYSPPAVSDGLVHIGVSEGDILALDAATGEIKWRRPGNGALAVPVVADGSLITTTRWQDVLCLDAATGDVRWEHPLESWLVPPAAIANGTVYLGTHTDVRALSLETGELVWRRPVEISASGAPVVDDGTLYIEAAPTDRDNFSAFDARTGEVLWSVTTDQQEGTYSLRYGPAVGSATVFVGTDAGTIHAFERDTGREEWSIRVDDPATSPTLAGDRLFFGAGLASTVHAVDPGDGTQAWKASVDGRQWYANPTVSDGTVYIGHWASAGTDEPPGVVAFDAETGDREWSVALEGNVDGKPTVDAERLYVPTGRRISALERR